MMGLDSRTIVGYVTTRPVTCKFTNLRFICIGVSAGVLPLLTSFYTCAGGLYSYSSGW